MDKPFEVAASYDEVDRLLEFLAWLWSAEHISKLADQLILVVSRLILILRKGVLPSDHPGALTILGLTNTLQCRVNQREQKGRRLLLMVADRHTKHKV